MFNTPQTHSFAKSRAWLYQVTLLVVAGAAVQAQTAPINHLKTFGTMGKEVRPLKKGQEAELFRYTGKGCLTHMWFGGSFKNIQYTNISYMESCIRAYFNQGADMLYLSSGLEDYFLGTYYFKAGRYTNKLAGLTHLDKKENEFSGYRLHEDDPVFFQNGLRLTNRCGEKIGDKIFHDPPRTRYTTYVWLYQWDGQP
jgi:hypothetical protein